MFSVNDFVATYENKTDEELIYMHRHMENYSENANEAVNIIIDKKGGLEKLLHDFTNKKVLIDEVNRIKKETVELGNQGVDVSLISTLATSDILTAQSVKEIVEQQYVEVELELKDKEINPRTIVGSIIGGIIASVIGGILWGIQLIYTHAIFYLLFFGLMLLCYCIIKISTKQSKKNNIVFVATLISVTMAAIIGQLLYLIIGYRG